MLRDSLRLLVGEMEADPDGHIRYKANPANLLEADGELRDGLVAGAGFEPAIPPGRDYEPRSAPPKAFGSRPVS